MKKSSNKNQIGSQEWAVREHYDFCLQLEADRLQIKSPVEFEITKRFMERWLPTCGRAADVGVGVGHYAEFLARRQWKIHLVDISQRFLDATCARLSQIALDTQIVSVSCCSGTDLAEIASDSCDAVLLLGPLYHLLSIELRQKAVGEAARILKVGGVIFAAGINRLAYFRDLLNSSPLEVATRADFHRQFLKDGNLDPIHAPLIGFAHLTTLEQFRSLFDVDFEELAMAGVESFSGGWQANLANMSQSARDSWLELVELTALTHEGLGASDHFLFIGKKR